MAHSSDNKPNKPLETPTPIPDEVKNYLAHGVAEDAKKQITSWARWIVGAFVVGFSVLGLTTYKEIKSTIRTASTEQIAKAKDAAENALKAFESASQKELIQFQTETKAAITEFKAAKKLAIENLEREILVARGEVQTAKVAAIEFLSSGTEQQKTETRTINRRAKVRPFGPGVSAGNITTTAGTVCCVVTNNSGDTFILSARFVFIGESDDRRIIQPGPVDGGTASDTIAMLQVSLPEMTPDAAGQTLLGQAVAIAKVLDDTQVYYDIPEIGALSGLAETTNVGDKLRLYGRTSGLSNGTVTDTKASLAIHLLVEGKSQPVKFKEMIMASRFSTAGDAGAPVVNDKNELVGILFAGSTENSIILPAAPVFKELGLSLVSAPRE